jgi:hypothetical protein
MIVGLLLASASAAPPADLDLQAVQRWENAAETLLDLPKGCWEWVGRASWNWDGGRFGATKGETAFAGRTKEGTWSSVHLEPLGEFQRAGRQDISQEIRVYDAQNARFAPLFGSLAGGQVRVAGAQGEDAEGGDLAENAEASNVLRQALEQIGGDASTSWVEWDDIRKGVLLHRTFPIEQDPREEVAVAVFFPGGGTAPTSLDVTFPEAFKQGRFPRWTVRDAKISMRAQVANDRVYPSSEAFSFTASFLGFQFVGAQTIQYRHAARCPEPPPAPVPAPATPVATPETPVATP